MVCTLFICLRKAMLSSFALLFCFTCFGQVSISGAKCVLPTLVYQYEVKGAWKENDKISICVEGGVLTKSGSTCTEKEALANVQVTWNEGAARGKITVSSQAGSADIVVSITVPLNPGKIETNTRQIVSFDKTPASLVCTGASGGNCTPAFSYQWEQSDNKLSWKPLAGSTAQNLSFSAPLKQSAFFRRKVVESASGTVGYSNAVAVFVKPEPKTK